MPRHIRKGDMVMVTAGGNRNTVSEVLAIVDGGERVVVKGVNIRTKHIKPTQQRPQGGIIQQEAPIHISNVSPVVDGKPTRVRFETKADGSKVRVAVRGGKELSKVHGPRSGKASPAAGASKAAGKATANKNSNKKAKA